MEAMGACDCVVQHLLWLVILVQIFERVPSLAAAYKHIKCPFLWSLVRHCFLPFLVRRCGVVDPSWSELQHFVWFINTQLVDFEDNQFVSVAAAEDLPGFSTFVLKFLLLMSRVSFLSRKML